MFCFLSWAGFADCLSILCTGLGMCCSAWGVGSVKSGPCCITLPSVVDSFAGARCFPSGFAICWAEFGETDANWLATTTGCSCGVGGGVGPGGDGG